jgi:serine/threonine protein kinase
MSLLERVRECSKDSNCGKISIKSALKTYEPSNRVQEDQLNLRSGDLRSGDLRSGGEIRSGDLRSGDLRSGGEIRSPDIGSGRREKVSWGIDSIKPIENVLSSRREAGQIQVINNYQILNILGKGTYGSVVKVRKYGKEYAAKRYKIKYMKNVNTKKVSSVNLRSVIVDISITRLLDHPYIVKLLDFFSTNDTFYGIIELGESDLYNYLDKYILEYNTKLKFVYQITQALKYLSYNAIVHCDMKTKNIIVKNGDIKLIDFGLSYIEGSSNRSKCETPIYKPPEQFFQWFLGRKDKPMTTEGLIEYSQFYRENHQTIFGKYDIENMEYWSYGLIVLEIAFNRHCAHCAVKGAKSDSKSMGYILFIDELYRGTDKEKIKQILLTDRVGADQNIDPLIELALSMLKIDPDQRRDYDSILSDRKLFNTNDTNKVIIMKPIKYTFTQNKTEISQWMKQQLETIYRKNYESGIFVYQLADFVIQKHDDYSHHGDDITILYASILINAAIYYEGIVSRATLETILGEEELKLKEDENKDLIDKVFGMVKWIIDQEKGNLCCDCIYNYFLNDDTDEIKEESYNLLVRDCYLKNERTPMSVVKKIRGV